MSTLTTGIVGYWKAEDTSDSTGNGFTLTNINSVAFNAAKINNGFDFGSTNSSKGMRIVSALNSTAGIEAISWAGWVNISTAPASGETQVIFNKMLGTSAGTTGSQWRFNYNNSGGTLRLTSQNDFGGSINITQTLTTGTWYHLAVTNTGINAAGSAVIYLNGSSIGSFNGYGQGDYSAYSSEMTFGVDRTGSGTYMKGLMDEWGLWNRNLSSSEVSQLYNSGAGLQYPFSVVNNSAMLAFF